MENALTDRIPTLAEMKQRRATWQAHRNNRKAPIDWRFATEDARIKLKRLYPKL